MIMKLLDFIMHAGTMMLEYRGEKRSGRVGRQAVSKDLEQRLAMLEAFLREATLYTSIGGSEKSGWMGLSCLCLSEQWRGFVGRLLDTYCQVCMMQSWPHPLTCSLSQPFNKLLSVLHGKLGMGQGKGLHIGCSLLCLTLLSNFIVATVGYSLCVSRGKL